MGIAAKHAYRFGFLKSEKWSNIRLEVLARKDAVCDICDVRDLSNDVHHVYYADRWEETPLEYLMVLCRRCHDEVHKKMETPEAKMRMFARIRREIRDFLKKPLVPMVGYEEKSAKELRAALDRTKKELETFKKNTHAVPVKIEEKRITQPKRVRPLRCAYCKIQPFCIELNAHRDVLRNSTISTWNSYLCMDCFHKVKIEVDRKSPMFMKSVRDLFDKIKDFPIRKQLTFKPEQDNG